MIKYLLILYILFFSYSLRAFDEIDLKSGLLINVCSYCGAYNNISFDRCQACGCKTRLGDKQF